MTHTPGPWRELAPGVISGATDPGWGAIANVPHADTEPESAANARLIAAAPELLSALEALITITLPYAFHKDIEDGRTQAVAAIKAAKEDA